MTVAVRQRSRSPHAGPPRARSKTTLPRHEEKIETILREAAALFVRQGFETTTLNDIADAVHIHKATIYHYIESKEEILYQCLIRSFADYEAVLEDLVDPSRPPEARLRRFFDILIAAQNNDFGRCLTIIGAQPLSQTTAERIKEFQRKLDSTVREIIRQGIAAGCFRECDPRLASAALFGAFNWVPRWYRPELAPSINALSHLFLDIFLHGLAAPQGTDPSKKNAA